jgi:mRNA interferase RelE/StbE
LAWRIEFETSAKKELTKLDWQAQKRIIRFLKERIAGKDDPRLFGTALSRDLAGLWKYRIGDFRLIADIRDDALLVLIVRVGHRSKIYGGH